MKSNISRRTLERYGFIETRLFWEGGITANMLAEAFDISRPAAQKVIDDYRKAFPWQMEYDNKLKRHILTELFKPEIIQNDPMLFLDYLRGQQLTALYRDEADWSDLSVMDVDRFLRPKLSLYPLKTVIEALRHRQVATIDYRKKDLESDSVSIRAISPNHLVFADNRYHIRAYCHYRNRFLDFVLSRIVHAEITDEDWVSSHDDTEWNETVTLRFEPNPELPESVRTAILRNYDRDGAGTWNITCRKALAFYIKRKLQAPSEKYGMPLWMHGEL